MSWMITRHGREHHLSGPQILLNQIDIADVANSLAQINRFTGHCTRPYSVAEHSLLVSDLARHDGKSDLVQLACLMHDAHEAFTGDQSSPAKVAIGLAWAAFEHRQADIVRRQLGLLTAFATHRQLVHHFDLIALATERRDLTVFDANTNAPWALIDTPGHEVPPASWVNLNSIEATTRAWSAWRDMFLERYFTLTRAVQHTDQVLAAWPHHPV